MCRQKTFSTLLKVWKSFKNDIKLAHIVVRYVDINVGFLKRQVYMESLFVQGLPTYHHLLVMDSKILWTLRAALYTTWGRPEHRPG